jgi:hypothetical protein
MMKIISFIEARQDDVIHKILDHCGLWHDPPSRGPPDNAASPHADGQGDLPGPRVTYEVDPDFLEHTRRERFEQPELPW